MGLLSQGSPLSWEETQRHAEHVRRHGILQFLHIYRAVAERQKDVLKWGDELHLYLSDTLMKMIYWGRVNMFFVKGNHASPIY